MNNMAIWLVKAKLRTEKLVELRKLLDSGKISQMRPFGFALDHGIRNAKINREDKFAYWEEEDYCHPPLAQVRAAVLDEYFTELSVIEDVKEQGRAWEKLEGLRSIWS
jgi:hypothetical protein